MTLVVRSLEQCEEIIETNLASFLEVAAALVHIRDNRLYRDSYATFEDYCVGRWRRGRRWGNRLIRASETVDALDNSLGPLGPKPEFERHARALASLKEEPEKLAAAWSDALVETDGQPTTSAVMRAVAKHTTHTCSVCGKTFEMRIWHCPTCDHHWRSGTSCPNCTPSDRTPTSTGTRVNKANPPAVIVASAINTLSGVVMGLERVDPRSLGQEEEAIRWADDLSKMARSLGSFAKQLRGATNAN